MKRKMVSLSEENTRARIHKIIAIWKELESIYRANSAVERQLRNLAFPLV